VSSLGVAFQAVLEALDRLEIPFFIGGSVASGNYGLPRQTNDIDIIADIRPDSVAELCSSLAPEFYVDAEGADLAVRQGRPFNLIHLKAAYKFDIFPVGDNRFTRSELSRRRYLSTNIPGLENIELPLSSPEDAILSKLVWFRKGGAVSDRQWHDILGMITVQSSRLDREYMKQWSEELGVADLLAKASQR
jgi:hypothetical protein